MDFVRSLTAFTSLATLEFSAPVSRSSCDEAACMLLAKLPAAVRTLCLTVMSSGCASKLLREVKKPLIASPMPPEFAPEADAGAKIAETLFNASRRLADDES